MAERSIDEIKNSLAKMYGKVCSIENMLKLDGKSLLDKEYYRKIISGEKGRLKIELRTLNHNIEKLLE